MAGLTGLKTLNLTFIGGGKMAQAMIHGLRHQANGPKLIIRAIDPNEKRIAELQEKEVQAFPRLSDDISSETDVAVFAVKPQQTADALKKLSRHPLKPSSLLISVVAGLTLKQIADKRPGTNALVRAMPNTPATINKGMTAWMASLETTAIHLEMTRWILKGMGGEERVKDEDAIDIATAISGSGPAYVLLLMESMIDSACHMGMTRDLARKLVEETFIGTSEYAKYSKSHPAILRDEITSPGGTTAAALHSAERGRFRSVVSDMTWAAYRRARDLGASMFLFIMQ